VKVECLRLLATLRLDPARTKLISGFVDTYLRLSQQEEQVFEEELGRIEPTDREGIMNIVTSWMEQGIEQGKQAGERLLILRQLTRKLGPLPAEARSQIEGLSVLQLERLAEALLDFSTSTDLNTWLQTDPH
jgi:predicted transposase YdaD